MIGYSVIVKRDGSQICGCSLALPSEESLEAFVKKLEEIYPPEDGFVTQVWIQEE